MHESQLKALAGRYESKHPREILEAALEQVPSLTFACSFGSEDMVLLDMLMKMNAKVNVFYLDTHVLFQETYDLIETAKSKYQIPDLTQVQSQLSLKSQAEKYGDALWLRDPNKCCSIRKVGPLAEHISKYDGWITGIRRDQAPTRAHAQAFEYDDKFKLVKVNPLILWTEEDVWNYIEENNVPYNPLHDNGYPSIGCIHCTRPVKQGDDPRSGRWAGFTKTECGLHK